MKIRLIIVTFAVMLLQSGCAKTFIPNTEIEANDFNQGVIDFCEKYRNAVQDRNMGLILSLASPRYFDTSGTMQGDDDMDQSNLEEMLKERFAKVENIRYEIHYRSIYEKDGIIYVEHTYTMSLEYSVGENSRFANNTSDNRFELEQVDGGFRLLSGM